MDFKFGPEISYDPEESTSLHKLLSDASEARDFQFKFERLSPVNRALELLFGRDLNDNSALWEELRALFCGAPHAEDFTFTFEFPASTGPVMFLPARQLPKPTTLLTLPTELRFAVIMILLEETIFQDGHVSITNLGNFPDFMRTCHKIRAEGRRLLTHLPLHIPRPLGPNMSIEAARQANGARAIYAPTPRFLEMKVPALHLLVWTDDADLKTAVDKMMEDYGLHPQTEIVLGSWRTPTGRGLCTKIHTFTAMWKKFRVAHPNPPPGLRVCATAVVLNLLPIFAWWKSSGITGVKEILILDLVGIMQWHEFVGTRPHLQAAFGPAWRYAICSLIVAIIAFQPDVPKIKITGLGPFLQEFTQLWDDMPKNQCWHNQEDKTRQPHPLWRLLCAWPFPRHMINLELKYDADSPREMVRLCKDNFLGVKDRTYQWTWKVHRARFNQYSWEFGP